MIFDGFKKEGLDFLDEIAQNNNKEWFELNKARYKKLILEPNIAFVNEMGEHLEILTPSIKALPKVRGSLFRIYRDIRFSHDKTPIKTKIGILFYKGQTHRMQSASFYMHYTSKEIFLATGIRTFKPPLLKKYRQYIKNDSNAKELQDILHKLQDKFELVKPHYKRYPAGFDKDDEFSQLSLYNSIYVCKSFVPNESFFSEDFVYEAFRFYEQSYELFDWLYRLTVSKNFT